MLSYRTYLSILLVTFAAAPALSYDGLAKDYPVCTSGQGKVANKLVVAACTRLINNAQKENATIGLFYALRASANSDKASNCKDAAKARKLISDPSLKSALDALEKQNC